MHFLLFLRSGNPSYQEEVFSKDPFIGAYTLNKKPPLLSSQWKDKKVPKVKKNFLHTDISVFICQRDFNSLKKKKLLKYPTNFKIISRPTENHHRSKIKHSCFWGELFRNKISICPAMEMQSPIGEHKFWNRQHTFP